MDGTGHDEPRSNERVKSQSNRAKQQASSGLRAFFASKTEIGAAK